jgi:ATP-dependent helicase/nuclease subunit A
MDRLMSARAERSRPVPTDEQRRAADPSHSAWVTASAGTGKTRVLADRVLRLLLSGTDPRQILCLTFTKAAAAEMVNRIQRDLGRFAVLPEAELCRELETLLGAPPRQDQTRRARALLATVLDLPAGLPIMTIHAFCQALLRRFPMEADVVPHFEVIEPRTAADLLREAQEEVLGSRRADLKRALDHLAVVLGERPFAEGLAALREDHLRLSACLERCGGDVEALIGAIHEALDVPNGATTKSLLRACCEDPEFDVPALRAACKALTAASIAGESRAATILAWLEAGVEGRATSYQEYVKVFLTANHEPRKDLITRGIAADRLAEAALLAEQARMARWVERCKAAAVAETTAAFLHVGAAVLHAYERRKRQQSALDYDDLIARTLHLLAQPDMAPWVRYKLDQQIDHLLVDEGQDTSPEQWTIIEALCAEFFVGEGARAAPRTLFVVGDEKQSIMSVQGADLETFQSTHARVRDRARAAGTAWREVSLRRSFRSAPAILRAVDATFEDPEARDGVVSGDEPLRHESARPDAAGIVEIWPLVEGDDAPKPEGWQLPDQHETAEAATARLARAIARQIFEWRRDGTRLPSEDRPIRPGDIMILLPRRGVLQELLIRELKRHNVAVAGADRLALTDDIAVMDLMALGDALLLPEDDLTFAAMLRSPLFGLSEEELFELAYDRGHMSLFRRLREMREARPSFAEACARFDKLLGLVDFLPPFELYARLLGEGGGRRRMLERLGIAAAEPIEAFLAQALAFEQSHPPSMQAFLHWLRADTTELIRDPDRPRDEVRVLTCHGAKGLEAPIVFLADTTFAPQEKDRLLWLDQGGLPVWKVGGKDRDPVSEAACQRARAELQREHRRLLYVAMTRARDWLIVAGCAHKKSQGTRSWHELITDGLDRLPGTERVRVRLAPDLDGEARRFADAVRARRGQIELPLDGRAAVSIDRPPWLEARAPAEEAMAPPVSPSRLGEDIEPPVASPRDAEASGRYRRGRVVHRLLQTLPGRPLEAAIRDMTRYLAQPSLGLDPAQQAEIAAEVRAVLGHPQLAPLFGPGSRAEVPIAGVLNGLPIAGQVDRLAVTESEVLVVDYKTNREPPASIDQVPEAYLRQMAAYRGLLQAIYPGRAVRCALLWTEGPTLMPVHEKTLASHAPGLP